MIRGDLKSLLTSTAIRIVILWADASYSSLILQNALDADVLGPQFTWILSSNVVLDSFLSKWYDKLSGMLTLEPVVGSVVHAPVNTTLLNAAYNIWQTYEPQSFPGSENVDYYALFAFDAAWALIQSLRQLCSTNTPCISLINTSYCFNRRLVNSRSFLDIINTNAFLGISGPIEFNANLTDRINGTYYIVKNVQSLDYVPVLVLSESGDWVPHKQANTIVWPGKSLVPPTGYADISGVTLRVAVTNAIPFTKSVQIKDNNGMTTEKVTGYTPDLIEYLREKMGFIPNITLLSRNQSYSALIDAVANNVYDMIVGDVTVYANRREKVAFSAPFFDNALRIVVRDTPTETVDFWAFLKPFSAELWWIILGALLWSTLLLCLFEGRRNRALRFRSCLPRLAMSAWYAFATLAVYAADFHVVTVPGRVLTAALYILSLVLIAQYQANLTSDLTISKTHSIISGLEDLKAGKIPFSRIGVRVNTAIEEFYLRAISGGSRNFYPLLTKEDTFQKLLDNVIDAALTDGGVAEYAVSALYCNLTLVGTAFDYSQFAIVTPKNWIYQQVLDVEILSLRELGILDILKSKWFQSSYCSQKSETSVELSMERMRGLLITFGAMTIIALFLCIMWPCLMITKRRLWPFVEKGALFIFRTPSQRSIASKATLRSYPSTPGSSEIPLLFYPHCSNLGHLDRRGDPWDVTSPDSERRFVSPV